MINEIYANPDWLIAHTTNGSKPYINTTQPTAGVLRYNSNVNGGAIEAYDGITWVAIGNGTTHIDLNTNAKEILQWARGKMDQEQQLKDMMNRHPGLRDLNDKFEMMKILCREEDKK